MEAPLQARNDSSAVQPEATRAEPQEPRFVDNRPAAVVQRERTEMLNDSQPVLQQRALSNAIHNSPRMVAQRHEMNLPFDGPVRPQGDGAIPTELSPVQREEKPNNTGLPNQLKSGIKSRSHIMQLKQQMGMRVPSTSAQQTVVQRKLIVDGDERDRASLASEVDAESLGYLVDHGQTWQFAKLKDAVGVSKMVKQIDVSTTEGSYAQKTSEQLSLDPGLHSILTHFRDPDHSQGAYDSKGKMTPNFPLLEPNLDTVLGDTPNSDLRDSAPTPGRKNEALVTAIKLKDIAMPLNVALEGAQAVDYIFKTAGEETRYGFDPFEMPHGGIENDVELNDWLTDAYEKHVRGKKGNVGMGGSTAHYSGLLDVSGISAEHLSKLISAITEYETAKASESADYEAPNLSLVNSFLTANNVATYDYAQFFQVADVLDDDAIGGLFESEEESG